MSRFTNSGRFIYAYYRTAERAYEELEDMYSTGDALPGEDIKVESIRDHRGLVKGYAITMPA